MARKAARVNNHAGYCQWLRAFGRLALAAAIEADPPDDSLPHSRAALIVYYRDDAPRLKKMFEAVFDPANLTDWVQFDKTWADYQAAEKAAVAKVQEAFFQDTGWLNSRDHCDLVGTGFVRKCVEAANPGVTWPNSIPAGTSPAGNRTTTDQATGRKGRNDRRPTS